MKTFTVSCSVLPADTPLSFVAPISTLSGAYEREDRKVLEDVKAWFDAAATRGAKTPMKAHELREAVNEALRKKPKTRKSSDERTFCRGR